MAASPTAAAPGNRPGAVGWYLARLRSMSAAEVAWRGASSVGRRVPSRTRVAVPPRAWVANPLRDVVTALVETRTEQLAAEAVALADGEVELWGRRLRFGPAEPRWDVHPDGARWPRGTWRGWDVDPKAVWELHKHQHLVALAAGAAAARRPDWSAAAVGQLVHWVAANPSGHGPGWTSSYDVTHRLFAWPLILGLAGDAVDASDLALLGRSYAEQAAFVRRRPSRFSSANNHRLAELTGLLAAALVAGDVARWERAWDELEREAARQTYLDGGSREQAGGYFLYALEILWGAGLTALACDRGLGRLAPVLARMLQWLALSADADGEPPPVGDDAEDRWLRLPYFERRRGAALAHRVERLLAGEATLALPAPSVPAARSHLLDSSGYAVLRGRTATGPVRVVMDVGELGLGRIAAHGHADALAVLADAGGGPLLVDSGTGSYLPGDGRDLLRGTAAHNTVVVGESDQAVALGPHLWGERYTVELEAAELGDEVDYVRASHDGYRRLSPPARHTRALLYRRPSLLVVLDRIQAAADCVADLRWHLVGGAEPALVVDAPPGAVERAQRALRSERYGQWGPGPCRSWRARGSELVFVTALELGGSTAPLLEVSRSGGCVEVRVHGRTPVRLTERWRGKPELHL